jgi:hypothetical protein
MANSKLSSDACVLLVVVLSLLPVVLCCRLLRLDAVVDRRGCRS